MHVEDLCSHLLLLGNNRILVVDSTSERAYLGALDRRIGDLSARSRVLFSVAHELAHHVLVDGLDEANNTGMASALNAINLVRGLVRPMDLGWLTFPTGDAASPFTVATPKYMGDSVPRLPFWVTRDVAGMLAAPGPDASGAAVDPTTTKSRLTVRISGATGSRLTNVRDALLQLIKAFLAMAHLCLLEIGMLRRERSHILARILASVIGLPCIRAFALIIIAVYRHYGHRSEPDDHASLLTRRHLVSMGSCPPI